MTSVHIYLSTHCFHGHHETCRLTCKFCPARCYCPCHQWDDLPSGLHEGRASVEVQQHRARQDAVDAPADQNVLSLEPAAAYISTTPRHLRRLYTERRIAYIKIGKRVAFLKADLDAFVQANRVCALTASGVKPGAAPTEPR